MKVYLPLTTLEAAKQRISWIFDEFEEVLVTVSGGKDSDVVFHLAYEEAKRRHRLPIKVFFLDQEAEWTHTIDWMRNIMYREDVEPYWIQVEFRIINATAMTKTDDRYLWCWKKGEEWLRDKEPIAITENIFGEIDFYPLYYEVQNYILKKSGKKKMAVLYGVRAEENPRRYLAMTERLTYKNVTWAGFNKHNKNIIQFGPIYDWSYTDVWKYIFENKIPYNKIYDIQYMTGVPVPSMRVSNLHHETALRFLEYLPEADIELWNKLVKRLQGVHSYNKTFEYKLELPYMFKDWKEYRDFLLEKLIDESHRPFFKKKFKWLDGKFAKFEDVRDDLYRMECRAIINNDWDGGTIMKNIDAQFMWKLRERVKNGPKSKKVN